MKRRSAPLLLSVGLVLLLAACQQNGPTIQVSPGTATVTPGDSAQTFTATVSGSSSAVTWSLSPATGSGTLSTTSGSTTQYTPPTSYASGGSTATLTATLQGTSTSANAVITIRAVTVVSDRHLKASFRAVDGEQVLSKVAALPMTTWTYTTDSTGSRHLGPMAQDFHAAFGLNGKDDRQIAVVDEGGVALAAIQGLYAQNQRLERQNKTLQVQLASLSQRLAVLEKR